MQSHVRDLRPSNARDRSVHWGGLGRSLVPCPWFWAWPGRAAIELPHEPFETLKIVTKALFGVLVRVIQNSNRAAPVTVQDEAQQGQVKIALAERKNLFAVVVAVTDHSVQVECEKIRFDSV